LPPPDAVGHFPGARDGLKSSHANPERPGNGLVWDDATVQRLFLA